MYGDGVNDDQRSGHSPLGSALDFRGRIAHVRDEVGLNMHIEGFPTVLDSCLLNILVNSSVPKPNVN